MADDPWKGFPSLGTRVRVRVRGHDREGMVDGYVYLGDTPVARVLVEFESEYLPDLVETVRFPIPREGMEVVATV